MIQKIPVRNGLLKNLLKCRTDNNGMRTRDLHYKGKKLSEQKAENKGEAVAKRGRSYYGKPSVLHQYAKNFEFTVDIGGYFIKCIRVSNLSESVETMSVPEGGNNDFPNLFLAPKNKEETLTLEKAFISGGAEADFYPGVHIENCTITILRDGQEQKRLGFDQGVIAKCEFSNLDAVGSEILMIKLEIIHSGLYEVPGAGDGFDF